MAKRKTAKVFILDTNVILHDATCINQFQEHDVIIPLTVIEELDFFKRGSQVINLNAREFARMLDAMDGNALFNGGVPLGKGRGKVRVVIARGLNEEIKFLFKEDTPDHRILSVASDINKKNGKRRPVVLITKDVNLRMKAKALGIEAEDYKTDQVKSIEELYSGKEIIQDFDDDVIIRLYQPNYEIPAEDVLPYIEEDIFPNKYFILRNSQRSVLTRLNREKDLILKVDKTNAYGIKPRNAE